MHPGPPWHPRTSRRTRWPPWTCARLHPAMRCWPRPPGTRRGPRSRLPTPTGAPRRVPRTVSRWEEPGHPRSPCSRPPHPPRSRPRFPLSPEQIPPAVARRRLPEQVVPPVRSWRRPAPARRRTDPPPPAMRSLRAGGTWGRCPTPAIARSPVGAASHPAHGSGAAPESSGPPQAWTPARAFPPCRRTRRRCPSRRRAPPAWTPRRPPCGGRHRSRAVARRRPRTPPEAPPTELAPPPRWKSPRTLACPVLTPPPRRQRSACRVHQRHPRRHVPSRPPGRPPGHGLPRGPRSDRTPPPTQG
ncbi:hypothetical protein COSO111634_33500 [Corallococcus soli]